MRVLRIGTRGSALALWQARAVAGRIEANGGRAELVTITTRGDRRQDVPLAVIGGKGVFVGEIHEALLAGEIDLAVHSAKDMPASSPEGVLIAAVLPREDPRDALVLPESAADAVGGDRARSALAPALPAAARIGTGSPRRVAQLRPMYAAARFEPIRGNVDTRLRKLDAGEVDLLVLACAGLRRLGLAHRVTVPLDVASCVPAPGQGIIAVEARKADLLATELLAAIDDASARVALAAEQAVVRELGGGCQLPLGVHATVASGTVWVRGVAASFDGSTRVDGEVRGDRRDPVEAGMRLARELAARGARELLQS